MSRFVDKVVIVTGSSTGIGRDIAICFAKEGAKVVITGRNVDNLQATRDEILREGVSENNVLSVPGDITVASFQETLITNTIEKWGKINVLVNNAGAGLRDPAGVKGISASVEIFKQNIQLNLTSVLELTNLATPYLEATHGEVINISSITSTQTGASLLPEMPFYCITKAALDQLTRTQALELIKKNVRVNAVNPGLIVTEFFTHLVSTEEKNKIYDHFGSTFACAPIGRVGVGSDIAEAVAFLADRSKSGFIVGQCIIVDGGSTLMMGCASAFV